MKKAFICVTLVNVSVMVVLIFASVGAGTISSQAVKQPHNALSPHTVIYRTQKYLNGTLKSEAIVSRSVNERGEWYEETLSPKNGKSVAILEDGHYSIDQQNGDKVQYKSSGPIVDCADRAEKVKAHAKGSIEVAGLTAYVIETGDGTSSYERAYAQETGCTPLRVRIKSNDGYEITYEALKVIFSVNSTFGKDMPVTKDIRKE